MSKKTKTELEILFASYDANKSLETAHELIEILRGEFSAVMKEKAILEADIRKLELFLASNA
jgi:ABC-type cobalamin transport system ATPase subunit